MYVFDLIKLFVLSHLINCQSTCYNININLHFKQSRYSPSAEAV